MNALKYAYDHLLVTPTRTSARKERTAALNEDANMKTQKKSTGTVRAEVKEDKKHHRNSSWLLRTLDWVSTIVFFFPRYLIWRPLIYLWYILTFPLSFIERQASKSKRLILHETKRSVSIETEGCQLSSRASGTSFFEGNVSRRGSDSGLNPIREAVVDDLMSGEEMFFQTDTVKGSLLTKSLPGDENLPQNSNGVRNTTKNNSLIVPENSPGSIVLGTKKMGRFLFPKKLIPRSILQSQQRKKLVLDLDETLIHSVSRGTTHNTSSQAHIVEVRFAISGVSSLYYVHKRPYCDQFLTTVSKWYDLIIFTASMKEYADPVIDWLESTFPGKFSKRYYRDDCILREGVGYIKGLHVINPSDSMHNEVKDSNNDKKALNDVIIIDNSPVSFALNVENAIQVEGWISDPTDTDLISILPFLEALRHTTDVRNILALKNGEHAFSTH